MKYPRISLDVEWGREKQAFLHLPQSLFTADYGTDILGLSNGNTLRWITVRRQHLQNILYFALNTLYSLFCTWYVRNIHTPPYFREGWNIGQFSDNMKEFGLIFLCTLSCSVIPWVEQQGSCLNNLFRDLKGLWHEIFSFKFFHESVSPGPLSASQSDFKSY